MVHRDLKPTNIMLGKSGAKVLDFGLAKIEQRITDQQETVTMTAEGTILGGGRLRAALGVHSLEKVFERAPWVFFELRNADL